jgi:predicted membrane-bound spermidine synthase
MRYLFILVFVTGAATLGMELSAARLLEPVFGNNQIVWAALIGLLLLYLAIGAWLGGQLADRYPNRAALDMVVTGAAVAIALIPPLSTPVLRMAAQGFNTFDTGLLAGSLLSILLLFSLPGILLGTVSPWAVRLAVHDLGQTGQTAGRLYASATAGSIVGTFLPVLLLIPAVGTRWTFTILALALVVVVVLGSLRRPHRWVPIGALLGLLLLTQLFQPGGAIRQHWDDGASGQIIYEDESRYNYIAVRQWQNERHLKLNDGTGIHSVYHPDMLLSRGIWDYFLLAPYFRPLSDPSETTATAPVPPVDDILLIGLAAGTVSELVTDIYGPIPITGIELDPQIIQVGREFFDMNQPNLTAIAADGRLWLAQQPDDARWDMIAVDAYRPPYIPFHLTTREFFQLAHDHLEDDGVLAINVGRTAFNYTLVDALAATLLEVFPTVYAIDEPGPADNLGNSLLVATKQPAQLAQFANNIGTLPDTLPAEFRDFAQQAVPQARTVIAPPDAIIFTDDRAPVELVVHRIIFDFMLGS